MPPLVPPLPHTLPPLVPPLVPPLPPLPPHLWSGLFRIAMFSPIAQPQECRNAKR
jgi:hypothetical protein